MLPLDPNALKPLAGKYIWWKTPDDAVAMPERVIAQVMNIGDYADWHYRLDLASVGQVPPIPIRTHVKVSFFGAIGFGRVGAPDMTQDGVLQVASPEDLMASKCRHSARTRKTCSSKPSPPCGNCHGLKWYRGSWGGVSRCTFSVTVISPFAAPPSAA